MPMPRFVIFKMADGRVDSSTSKEGDSSLSPKKKRREPIIPDPSTSRVEDSPAPNMKRKDILDPSISRGEDSLSPKKKRNDIILSPQKKRKPIAFSVTEKEMITNAYKYIYNEKQTECPYERPNKEECVRKASDTLGISKTSVYQVLKEHKENAEFSPPKKPGPKSKRSTPRTERAT